MDLHRLSLIKLLCASKQDKCWLVCSLSPWGSNFLEVHFYIQVLPAFSIKYFRNIQIDNNEFLLNELSREMADTYIKSRILLQKGFQLVAVHTVLQFHNLNMIIILSKVDKLNAHFWPLQKRFSKM